MNYYVVDAFTDSVFSGNPAGVCVLERWLDKGIMQKIAAENNLSETAFVVKAENEYELKWFTPKAELYLSRDLFIVLETEEQVLELSPDFSQLLNLKEGLGVIVSAQSKDVDFVSRCFFPKLGVNEDPVTGSAYSSLIPFWSRRITYGRNH